MTALATPTAIRAGLFVAQRSNQQLAKEIGDK
jgi:hypothetical protein